MSRKLNFNWIKTYFTACILTYISCFIYSILFFLWGFSAWGLALSGQVHIYTRSITPLNFHLFLAGARRGCHFVCICPSVSVETLHRRAAVSGCLVAPFHPSFLIRTWRKSVAGDGVRRQDGTARQLDTHSIREDTHNQESKYPQKITAKETKQVSYPLEYFAD